MESIGYNTLTGLKRTNYGILMEKRIKRVLMICSSYDAYMLEEDGQIEVKLYREYVDLNISNPPTFTWVRSVEEAKQLLMQDSGFDLIICMFNAGDMDIFKLSGSLKEREIDTPVVLLTHFSKEAFKRLEQYDRSSVDYVFSWNGNADLILAIIKLIEDKMNAYNDIITAGIQCILLVEDSIRYYSTYLPAIYKLVLQQSAEFLKETLNEQQQKMRKRARPKILLATNYEDAAELYAKYKHNILGVISDIGFTMRRNDPSTEENLEAGLLLARMIKEDNKYVPILLQSSQESLRSKAEELGCGFLVKYSMTLLLDLSEYIKEEFVFGDFVFRDLNNGEIIGIAKDLKSMQSILNEVPDDVLYYHASRNRISKWLFSRGLFMLAREIKSLASRDYASVDEIRKNIIRKFKDYRMLIGQGVVAKFNSSSYNKYLWYAKIGEGSLGGKARGLAFINSTLQKYNMLTKYEGMKIMIPRSIVIATDYFDKFIQNNGLQYVINSDISDTELLSEFVSSRLPEDLSIELRAYLETVNKPLAVRSSSKLEDSHFQPFAGIYSTYMIPVTENKDQMLRLLEKAIKSVYASVFFTASRSYIHTTGNMLGEEKMAIVIQGVCGTEDQGYYFPTISGVARSLNHYPISDEKPQDGIVNMAFGLGRLIVEGGQGLRFSPKHPSKILQLSTPKLALRDTQSVMYALNLEPEKFKTSIDEGINIQKFTIPEAGKFRNIKYVASSWDMYNDRIVHNSFDNTGYKIITFANILQFNKYPVAKIISELLAICESELRSPVEIEFAVNLDVPKDKDAIFYVLQVRPIAHFEEDTDTREITSEDISKALIYTPLALGPGHIDNITDLIYIKSGSFDKSKTEQMVKEINALNSKIKGRGGSYMLIGPGRWGSSDPWLGVPVQWNDISEAKVIVETALKDFQIEPSQGTHFFQNITSLGVGYMTVNEFSNDGFFRENELADLPAEYESRFIRHIPLAKSPSIYINGKEGKGIVTLDQNR